MHFARERLVLRRNSLNLSQEALAEKAKLSKRSIVAWESGQGSPTTSNLEKLAGALGVSSAWLVGAEDIPGRQAMALRDESSAQPNLDSLRLALRALKAQATALVDQIGFYERHFCDRPQPKPAPRVSSEPSSAAAPLAESAGETYDRERRSKS